MKTDISGNYIVLDITVEGGKDYLINIYGPNDDKPQFYENILDLIEEFENDKSVICGYFNLVLNQNLDTKTYLLINNPTAKAVMLEKL